HAAHRALRRVARQALERSGVPGGVPLVQGHALLGTAGRAATRSGAADAPGGVATRYLSFNSRHQQGIHAPHIGRPILELTALAPSSACFFSASSCSCPRSTEPFATLCSALPSNS